MPNEFPSAHESKITIIKKKAEICWNTLFDETTQQMMNTHTQQKHTK